MKPEPKWMSYSIIIGGIIMFSGIFIASLFDIPWWISPLLGGLIIVVPWVFLWKPQKGHLKFTDNSLTYNLGNDTVTSLNYSEIQKLEFSFKHYEGQSESILGLLSSWWPFYGGYENMVTLFLKDYQIEFGVYAENKHQLKEFKRRFELIADKINTLHNST